MLEDESPAPGPPSVEDRLCDVEVELADAVAVLNAHADLFRSIGALTAVLAVGVDPDDEGV